MKQVTAIPLIAALALSLAAAGCSAGGTPAPSAISTAQPSTIAAETTPTVATSHLEYLKGEAEDNGEVLATDELVQVPTGRYRQALLTKDTSTIEPTVVAHKLYVPGVGPARRP